MGGCSQVVSVDTSQEALDIARQNVELNKLDLSKAEFVRDDVFKLLRTYRDRGEKFDVIVMDPPKFVENKSQLMGACRGYKDINMLAIQLLNEGGILLTFSCSGLMTSDLFQKIIADAAIDAGRDVQFIEQFRQAADHPVIATYPEGLYLKGKDFPGGDYDCQQIRYRPAGPPFPVRLSRSGRGYRPGLFAL